MKMDIIRFLAVTQKVRIGEGPVIKIDSLGFKANVGESMQVYNRKAFRICFDQNGHILNLTDLVHVTIQDLKTRKVYFDKLSVEAIAEHSKVQGYIQDYLKNSRWNQAEVVADKANRKLASSLPSLEIDMLFEQIHAMHVQHAIDKALDNQDKNAFMQLTRGKVGAL